MELLGGPKISHLLFADDLLFFAEVTLEQVEVAKSCLARFEKVSGKRVNSEKSHIFLSPNLDVAKTTKLSIVAGMPEMDDLAR